jgi:hypothetical protein
MPPQTTKNSEPPVTSLGEDYTPDDMLRAQYPRIDLIAIIPSGLDYMGIY